MYEAVTLPAALCQTSKLYKCRIPEMSHIPRFKLKSVSYNLATSSRTSPLNSKRYHLTELNETMFRSL